METSSFLQNVYVVRGDSPGKYNLVSPKNQYKNVTIINRSGIPFQFEGKTLTVWEIDGISHFGFFPDEYEAFDMLDNKIRNESNNILKISGTVDDLITIVSPERYLELKIIDDLGEKSTITVKSPELIYDFKLIPRGKDYIFYNLSSESKADILCNNNTKCIPLVDNDLPQIISLSDYILNKDEISYLTQKNICTYGIVDFISEQMFYNQVKSYVNIIIRGSNNSTINVKVFYPKSAVIEQYIKKWDIIYIFHVLEIVDDTFNVSLKDILTI